MRFAVVLFDLDGTLIDSGPIILASMKPAARSVLGIQVDDVQGRQASGRPAHSPPSQPPDHTRTTPRVHPPPATTRPLPPAGPCPACSGRAQPRG